MATAEVFRVLRDGGPVGRVDRFPQAVLRNGERRLPGRRPRSFPRQMHAKRPVEPRDWVDGTSSPASVLTVRGDTVRPEPDRDVRRFVGVRRTEDLP